jgi:hypothetical protein
MTDTMPLSDHPADKLQAALNHGWPDPDRDFPPDYLAACTRWFDACPRVRATPPLRPSPPMGGATKSPPLSSRASCRRRRCLRPRADHLRRKAGLRSGSAKAGSGRECVAPFSPRRQLGPHASSRDRSTGRSAPRGAIVRTSGLALLGWDRRSPPVPNALKQKPRTDPFGAGPPFTGVGGHRRRAGTSSCAPATVNSASVGCVVRRVRTTRYSAWSTHA